MKNARRYVNAWISTKWATRALFLVSPAVSGHLGEVIYVDGGYHILGV